MIKYASNSHGFAVWHTPDKISLQGFFKSWQLCISKINNHPDVLLAIWEPFFFKFQENDHRLVLPWWIFEDWIGGSYYYCFLNVMEQPLNNSVWFCVLFLFVLLNFLFNRYIWTMEGYLFACSVVGVVIMLYTLYFIYFKKSTLPYLLWFSLAYFLWK